MSADTRFDLESFNALLPSICERDTDAVTDWVVEHIQSRVACAQLLETLPRIAAILARVVFEKPSDDPDESWVIKRTDGKDGRATDASTQSTRMIVAALNNDADALTGIVKAALDAPEDYIASITFELLRSIADFYDLRPKPEGSES